MTYTAENIRNIKAAGQLDSYIAHEREIIEAIESADIIYDAQGSQSASIAHLYGRYEIDAIEGVVVVSLAYDGDWTRKFTLASFGGDQSRALAYAKATLRNRLIEDGKALVVTAKARLVALEAE